MRRAIALSTVSVIIVLIAACKPSAGSACTENAKTCDTPTSRMACVNNKYVPETCKGEGGCKETPSGTTCDSAKGDVGDTCASANNFACSTDGKSKLRCEDGHFAFVQRCSKDGCTVGDTATAHCNDPYGKVGDDCKYNKNASERANGACNEDFKSELRCKDGKMSLTNKCRGEAGCVPLTTGPWCDRSMAEPGDNCDANTPEFSVGCLASKEKILTCVGGKLTREVRCGGEGKCYVRQYGQDGFSHYQAVCDQSLAEVGEDCIKDGGLACQTDLTARLVCSNGKFAVDKPCNMKVAHKKDEPDRSGCMVHAPDGSPFGCEDEKPKK